MATYSFTYYGRDGVKRRSPDYADAEYAAMLFERANGWLRRHIRHDETGRSLHASWEDALAAAEVEGGTSYHVFTNANHKFVEFDWSE